MNYCCRCHKSITPEESHFSKKNFNKDLCRKHQPTKETKIIGKALQKNGWDVIYEKFDGYKHVDLSIPAAKVDIEIDGLHHTTTTKQAMADLSRTFYSYKNDGIITLHIPNILVRDDSSLKQTISLLNNFLEENYKDVSENKVISLFKKFFSIDD